MKNYRIKNSSLSGTICAPPSKSHTLRAILLASMACGTSHICRYLQSPDTMAMVVACRQLGAMITMTDERIEVVGVCGKPRLPDDVIDAGNSGQVLRFVAAMAALNSGHTVITGDHSIRFNRPLAALMQGLSDLGATCISTKNDGYAPLVIKGPIAPGIATLDGQDSQPVSALLLASAFLPGHTTINVSDPGEKAWVGVTLSWLDRLGVAYTNDNFRTYTVEGCQNIKAFDYWVPGDFSSVAYPLVAALATNSALQITHVDMHDAQGDKKLIDILIQMGADIKTTEASITVLPGQSLRGCDIDVNDIIDAVPILAVTGCFATGTTRLVNAGIARKKESDRLSTITTELQAMGAIILEHDDHLTIQQSVLQSAILKSHHDHRIAMSLAVAAMTCRQASVIEGVECVAKSYPNFCDDMFALGATIEEFT